MADLDIGEQGGWWHIWKQSPSLKGQLTLSCASFDVWKSQIKDFVVKTVEIFPEDLVWRFWVSFSLIFGLLIFFAFAKNSSLMINFLSFASQLSL